MVDPGLFNKKHEVPDTRNIAWDVNDAEIDSPETLDETLSSGDQESEAA